MQREQVTRTVKDCEESVHFDCELRGGEVARRQSAPHERVVPAEPGVRLDGFDSNGSEIEGVSAGAPEAPA